MNHRISLQIYLLFTFYSSVFCASIRNCDKPLGLESGEIKDSQLSASSSFDVQSVGPQNARIRQEIGSGAWCPEKQINGTVHESIQVSFPDEILLTAVETQGRFDEGRGAEYASAYMIEYWRNSLGIWQRYKDSSGNEIIPGNSDTKTAVLNTLETGIVANLVRIIPVSEFTRTVCLRFELYGCLNQPGRLVDESLATDPLVNENTLTYISISNDKEHENESIKCIVLGIIAASTFGILSLAVLLYLLLCTRQIINRNKRTTDNFGDTYFGPSCQKGVKMAIHQCETAKRYVTPPMIPFSHQNRYDSGFHDKHLLSTSPSSESSSEYAEPECENLSEPLIKVYSPERSSFHRTNESTHYASSLVTGPVDDEQPLSSFERFAHLDRKLVCDVPVVEFNKKAIQLVEQIGSGEFGELQVCTLDHSRHILVRYANRDKNSQKGFEREKRVLSQLSHQNLVAFYGVVNNDGLLGSVFEFPTCGDLPHWLRKQSEISHEQLLSIVTDVAAGVAYLESLQFVHRDLSARNCLVDADGTIKISDFAIHNQEYSDDYSLVRAGSTTPQLLPLRWLACECVETGVFTSQTDSWALGVTIWEIFNLCSEQPYSQLEDADVLNNLKQMTTTGVLMCQLECPESCPVEIYSEIHGQMLEQRSK
ncbi:Coagulation factor 5 8 type and Tyrosine protein kinase domain containing protein, protein [Aphelenchoides bicaudatus]|nr:Coagulation factor 5 8 type and Tyrosine protein kinase domain containing protein, protein [Aphelenchoides bicaudatus]